MAAADSVPSTSSKTTSAAPSIVVPLTLPRRTNAPEQIDSLLILEEMDTADTLLSAIDAAPAHTTPPPPSPDRPTNSRMNNNHRQGQENGGDSGEHLRLGGGGHRGWPGPRHGHEHRGGYGFNRHRRDGWRGRYGRHGQELIQPYPHTGFAPPPPHHPLLGFLPPPPPYFGAYHEPMIGYAPQGEYDGPMIGHALPGFGPGDYFPQPPQQTMMIFLPFPSPPNMEELKAPLTEEECEKRIRKQIEYYFSENNLCFDVHLKSQMNQQGWVPLTLVAGFPRVQALTTDYDIVRRSVLSSTEVEMKEGRIRRRTGWEKYILPSSFIQEDNKLQWQQK